MNDTISSLRIQLKEQSDEKTRASGQRYFKGGIKAYGVKNPVVHRLGREAYREIKTIGKAETFILIESLWQSGMLEESLIACDWTYSLRKKFLPADFETFRKWIGSYVNNWAVCDAFCNHSMGEFIEMYPEYRRELVRFAASENMWMRRAAAVTFIIPARKGLFRDTIFEIADRLLTDPEDLVQKGYGWLLKAASEANENEVFDYVMKNKAKMPRTALRYSIEKMPDDLKAKAMKK